MELTNFDIAVTVIVLFLGLKGIINGFFKEIFGLIGIVGGIFVASRVGDEAGKYLSDLIFKFENEAAISFTGFVSTLVLFWLVMIIIGFIFKKLTHMSGLTPMDKLLGFIFGASKFFLIAAVIANATYNINALKKGLDPLVGDSVMFPILVQTGAYIMKLDPVEITSDINASVHEHVNSAQEHFDSVVKESAKEMIEEVKEDIKNSIPKAKEELERAAEAQSH